MYMLIFNKPSGQYHVVADVGEHFIDPVFLTDDLYEAMQVVSFLNGGAAPAWLGRRLQVGGY